MNAVELAGQTLRFVHQTFTDTIADLTDATVNHEVVGKAGTIASSIAHLVVAEDSIAHILLGGTQTIAEGEYAGLTGINRPQWFNDEDWRSEVRVEMAPFRAYAAAVFLAAEARVAAMTEQDLDRPMDLTDFGLGHTTAGWVIGALLITHGANLTGEVSALKGAAGLAGYPF